MKAPRPRPAQAAAVPDIVVALSHLTTLRRVVGVLALVLAAAASIGVPMLVRSDRLAAVGVIALVLNAAAGFALRRYGGGGRGAARDVRLSVVTIAVDWMALAALASVTGGPRSPALVVALVHLALVNPVLPSGTWRVPIVAALPVLVGGSAAIGGWQSGSTGGRPEETATAAAIFLLFACACVLLGRSTPAASVARGESTPGATPTDETSSAVEADREFVGRAAHNLRAGVGAVRTMLTLLRQGYVGVVGEAQATLLDRALARLAALQSLVDDLADLAATHLGLARDDGAGPTRLVERVRDVCARVQATPLARHVTVTCRTETFPLEVAAAPGHVDLILTHLLENAVTYTPSGEVRVEVRKDGRYARLTVADDGIGIADADRAHVGERFFRTDRARALHEHGTGLGLAIVRAVVGREGGTLQIDSTDGQGTTVTVRLPLSRGPA